MVQRLLEEVKAQRDQSTGGNLVKRAPPMSNKDLKKICGRFYEIQTNKSIEDRATLSGKWQCIGRVSEISSLLFKILKFNGRY
jgi:hypothetical protein